MKLRRQPTLFLLFLLAMFACGGCGASREKTLNTTLTAVNAAREGFMAWDEAHQTAIVERATSLESGRAELVAYREKQAKVVHAIVTAYVTIGLAASGDGSLQALVSAMVNLKREVDALMKGGAP